MTDAISTIKKKNLISLFRHYIDIITDNEEYINSQVRTTNALTTIEDQRNFTRPYLTEHRNK